MQSYSPRRVSWAATLLAVALLCLVAYLIAWQLFSPNVASQLTAIPLPCTSSQQIKSLNEGVLFYDGTLLHALDDRGRQIWAYTAGAGVGFDVDDGGVAVWQGDKLTLLSGLTGVPVYSGTMGGNILSAKMGVNYAAVQLGTEQNSSLTILSLDGGTLEVVPLPQETLLDYGFFSNNALLWTMTLDSEGTMPKTTITTRRPGRMTTGNVEETGQFIHQVFFRSDKIVAVGSQYMTTYDYMGKESADRVLVYGWQMLDVGGSLEAPLMVFAPEPQAQWGVSVSDVRLIYEGIDRTIRMPFPCLAVAASQSTVYGFHRQYIMSYRISDAQPTTREAPIEIDQLIDVTRQGSAIVASGGNVYLIHLQ